MQIHSTTGVVFVPSIILLVTPRNTTQIGIIAGRMGMMLKTITHQQHVRLQNKGIFGLQLETTHAEVALKTGTKHSCRYKTIDY